MQDRNTGLIYRIPPWLTTRMKIPLKKGRKAAAPFRLRGKSVTRLCMFNKLHSAGHIPGRTPVYLNVYDLTPMNGYMYWAGLGVFHSGVEVHGIEYAFGAHDFSTSGVFEVEPRRCPGFKFRKTIFIGTTRLDPVQVREFIEVQSLCYSGDTYHLITKNCNNFCEDICFKLTGKQVPKWVNRLATIGSLCNCLLPAALQVPAVSHEHDCTYQSDAGEEGVFRYCSCFPSISMRQKHLSSLLMYLPFKRWLSPLQLKCANS